MRETDDKERERERHQLKHTREGRLVTQVKLTGQSERCGEAQEQQEVKSET